MNAPVASSGLSRRTLLKAGAAGTLVLGFHLPLARAATGTFEPNAFIRIAGDGAVTLVMPQVEMGQGTYTSISQILAEELDADWSRVTVEHAPPSDKLYGNPFFGIQVTGNSNSIRAFWDPLRKAGATARALLVQAAAQQWQVEPATCRTANSEVLHDPSGRKLGYGELAAAAGTQTPPENPPLKAVKDFTLVSKPVKRLDTAGKVNGAVKYGIDALPPGVKFASLTLSPVQGGKVVKGRRFQGEGHARRAAGRRAGRCRRGGRRPHLGGETGLGGARDRMG